MLALYYLFNVASLFNTVFSLKPYFKIKKTLKKTRPNKEFYKTWK